MRGHQQLPGECLSSSPPASASRSCLVSHQHQQQQGASTSSPVQPVPSCLVFSVCWVSHYQPEGFKSLSTLCPCEAPWIHLASPAAARPVQDVLRKLHSIYDTIFEDGVGLGEPAAPWGASPHPQAHLPPSLPRSAGCF